MTESQRKTPDREKVIEALEICATGTNSCNKCPMKDKCHGVSNAAMVAAIKLLKEQEEVVRCKDCKYWQDNNGGYPHRDCKWNQDETPDPDDFCSAGERIGDRMEVQDGSDA